MNKEENEIYWVPRGYISKVKILPDDIPVVILHLLEESKK